MSTRDDVYSDIAAFIIDHKIRKLSDLHQVSSEKIYDLVRSMIWNFDAIEKDEDINIATPPQEPTS